MSSLETSVTLEDVFTVVESKRVPLAPELAGYLSLEIGDGADAGGGAVDPRSVFISEEGTVALIKKKDAAAGDAEASVRGILQKLLDASGSSTPALSAAAKRKPVSGLPALVEELEAALIPVNRAAGRRALARLAREVKRVTMGVGRNASIRPVADARREPESVRGPSRSEEDARPVSGAADVVARARPRGSFGDEEAVTAKRSPLNELQMMGGGVPGVSSGESKPLPPIPGRPSAGAPAPPPRTSGLAPPPGREARPPALTAPPRRGEAQAPAEPPAPPPNTLFGGSEVDDLLAAFEVSGAGDKEMSRGLKAIAGLEPTPPPPDARSIADLVKDVGNDLPKKIETSRDTGRDSVEALLALADASGPSDPIPGLKIDPPKIDPPKPEKARVGPPPLPPLDAPNPFSIPPVQSPFGGVPAAPVAPPPPPLPLYEPPPPVPLPEMKRPITPPKAQKPPSGQHKKGAAPDLPPPAPLQTTARRPKKTERRPKKGSKTGIVMLILAVVVVVTGGIATYMMKPAFFTGKKTHPPQPTVAPTPPPPPAPRCKVALIVTDAPANAEILLRVGQSPLDVERMPVGTRLEFVATAEGYSPRRAIIKAESPWDKTADGKPKIDLPVQLDPSRAKPGTIDPWPQAEPGSQVGGSGAPGTVHVVANVRGAEIWLLAGLGPEARIEQLRCDSDIDVLLAGPQALRKRLHVAQKEVEAAPPDPQGNKVVTTSAK